MTDNIKLPPIHDELFGAFGPIWRHIIDWGAAEPGAAAREHVVAIEAAITKAMHEHAREAVRLNAQAVPDTREMFNAGWCAAARFCDREDVVYDGLVGPGGCPAFESAYRDAWTELSAAPQPAQPLTDEQAHGIGVKS